MLLDGIAEEDIADESLNLASEIISSLKRQKLPDCLKSIRFIWGIGASFDVYAVSSTGFETTQALATCEVVNGDCVSIADGSGAYSGFGSDVDGYVQDILQLCENWAS